MTVRQIITEVLNEGIEGSLKPNDYAKGKIETALKELRQMVGEMKKKYEYLPTDPRYCLPDDEDTEIFNSALDSVMEKMR